MLIRAGCRTGGVGKEGTIQAFTIVPSSFESMPHPFYATAIVMMDRANTAMADFVKNADLKYKKMMRED